MMPAKTFLLPNINRNNRLINSVPVIKFVSIALVCVFFGSPVAPALAAPETEASFLNRPSSKYSLDTGLDVIIKEDSRQPIATILVLVGTGSANQSRYAGSGICHFIEHMLFKGTGELAEGEFHQRVKSLGGTTNGFTSLDYTGYYITVPSENFKEALELISEIIKNPAFDARMLAREKEVILKEIIMGEDDPHNQLMRSLWETAFIRHPYRYPVIGYKDLFKSLGKNDLESFYREVYAPDNTIIAVVGDIEKQKVYQQVKELLSDYKRRLPAYSQMVAEEPAQQTERQSIRYLKTKSAYLALGYKSIDINSGDLYALDVLAAILGQGRSSRLNITIKDKLQLASSVAAYNYTPRYKGLFIIQADFPHTDYKKLISTIKKEIEILKNRGIDEAELDKAKNLILSDYLNYIQTTGNQAREIASSLMLSGDEMFLAHYLEGIEKVSRAEVIEAARRYLAPDKLSISVILPDTASRDVESEAAASAEVSAYAIEKERLNNQAALLMIEDDTLPLISIQVVFKGGVLSENRSDNGICNLLSKLLIEGTRRLSKENIDRQVESRGASLSSYSGHNSLGLSMNLMSKDIDFALELLAELISEPVFRQEDIKRNKNLAFAALQHQQDDIFHQGFLIFKKNFFGNHPYSLDPLGNKASLEQISRQDILGFYGRLIRPDNMTISVAGDIDKKEVSRLTKKHFKDFLDKKPAEAPELDMHQDKLKITRRQITEKVDKEQALILVGFPIPPYTDKKYETFMVLDGILSGGGSRLFYNLREKKGLAYSVGTFNFSGFSPGCFVFYLVTSKDKLDESKESLLAEIERIRKEGISQSELTDAQNYLIGNHLRSLQSYSGVAFEAALDQMYGLDYNRVTDYPDKIKSITADDIHSAVSEYISPEKATIVILKPAD